MTRDAKNHSLRDAILPTVYIHYPQARRLRSMTFSMRTEGDPAALVGNLRPVASCVRVDPLVALRFE